MSDASVLYKSCVAHLARWTTLCAECKCFALLPLAQTPNYTTAYALFTQIMHHKAMEIS